MSFFEQVGKMAVGTRVRFLSESILKDAAQVYQIYGIELNPKWFPVFYVLSKESDKTITSIAETIRHSHVSVSKIAAEMIKAGLVVEKSDLKDRRRTLLSLSKAGQSVARRIEDQYTDVNAAVEEMSSQAKHNLWKAIEEWEHLLEKKSLFLRVLEKKKQRESKSVKVVPYLPKFKDAFYKLNKQWISQYFKMEKPDHDALENPKKYILDRGGAILVALLDDKPVGVCALLKRDDKKYPVELVKMAVAPEARGKSIGWLLGLAAIEKAREMKAKRLFLESNTVLKPAIGLYEKLGFKKIEGPPTPYERCNIQMELEL